MTTVGRSAGLNTVSLRRRVTVVVIAVLGLVLVGLGLVVNAVFAAQSERNLDTLLSGRVQLARQLARNDVGAQALVNRVGADGVRAHLVLRSGAQFGTEITPGDQIRTTNATLNAAGRLNRAELTIAVDTSLVDGAKRTLRQALIGSGLAALALSAVLVAIAVRLALRPLTAMATLARTIADGQRGQRLDPTRVDTELGQTASAFDEMLDELEGAESRARVAEERTRAFLADAAHELRTPIAGVQTAAETLLHGGSQLAPAQREQLEVLLVREAQRAGKLVSDLLVTARLDVGVDLAINPLTLRPLVQAEVDRARLLQAGVTVELNGPDLTVPADRDKIGSILRNLIDNALRACGPTGSLHVRLSEQPGLVVVEVQDSGPGVPMADRERVFDRLVRLDTSRTQDRGGSGLGLAIARGFARAHGGDLTCEPSTGGALFRLSLPTEPVSVR